MLRAMALQLDQKEMASTIWGFDSFRGLPKDSAAAANGTFAGLRGNWGMFRAGELDVRRQVEARNQANGIKLSRSRQEDGGVGAAMDAVYEYVNSSRLRLVPGFFNVSLTATLAASHSMKPALYVDIDSDQYIGSFQALDWLCRNGLLVNGTIIGYDDFNHGYPSGYKGWPPHRGIADEDPPLEGEARAHREIEKRWGLRFTQLRQGQTSGPESGWAFEVTHAPG
jgi:hypothetical protein